VGRSCDGRAAVVGLNSDQAMALRHITEQAILFRDV